MQFDDLPIHDATLASVHVSYEAARCDLVLYVVGGAHRVLVFEGFHALTFPRRELWGRSHSINAGRQVDAQVYEVDLQSGDVLRVEADRWRFEPNCSDVSLP